MDISRCWGGLVSDFRGHRVEKPWPSSVNLAEKESI